MKYKNKKTGMIWESDNTDYVVKLIETNSDFELYEEEKPVIQDPPIGIDRAYMKPKQTKTKK